MATKSVKIEQLTAKQIEELGIKSWSIWQKDLQHSIGSTMQLKNAFFGRRSYSKDRRRRL
jgi:hypothetical protein